MERKPPTPPPVRVIKEGCYIKHTDKTGHTCILCILFGHKMRVNTNNATGSSTCKRCGYTEAGIVWPSA